MKPFKLGLCLIIFALNACGFQKDPDMSRQAGTRVPPQSHDMKIDATSTPPSGASGAQPSPQGSVMPKASPPLKPEY